ncbi:MAG TPA: 4a-hydroxytetrahydrobiopterin dehydratase [Thiobacillaceae bacterium]|nr:4a-hydroxytetrahydrobiopterin dehydratase [Thiobacillaceae bacterium]HNI08056.1 4a-hydroxytetrahydrobiopterin dehydratase [Thiobacillaceae bacterium]
MSETPPAGWQVQAKPPMMTRRFDFPDYAATRGFLDGLAKLSEKSGYYPDLNFAKTHVSVSVAARDTALGPDEYTFADRVDALASGNAGS